MFLGYVLGRALQESNGEGVGLGRAVSGYLRITASPREKQRARIRLLQLRHLGSKIGSGSKTAERRPPVLTAAAVISSSRQDPNGGSEAELGQRYGASMRKRREAKSSGLYRSGPGLRSTRGTPGKTGFGGGFPSGGVRSSTGG